jgi:DNA-binding NarL/FixJ family response regulator
MGTWLACHSRVVRVSPAWTCHLSSTCSGSVRTAVGRTADVSGVLRVVVADDHALMRSALSWALAASSGVEVVGEVENGHQLLALLPRVRTEAVLMDIEMPGLDGFACLDAMRRDHPSVRAIVVSAHHEASYVERAFRLGAAGYVLKTIDPLDLAAIVRATVGGMLHIAGSLSLPTPEERGRRSGLSEKEGAVLVELALGKSNREIARTLWLSEQTVKFHLKKIYRKLDVANRTEALKYAHDHDLTRSAA